MVGEVITFPFCSGTLVSAANASGQYVLTCSVDWQVKSGLLIDPAYLSTLQIMLDQGGIDWATSYQVMGYALGFTGIGMVFGYFFNLLRRGKPR